MNAHNFQGSKFLTRICVSDHLLLLCIESMRTRFLSAVTWSMLSFSFFSRVHNQLLSFDCSVTSKLTESVLWMGITVALLYVPSGRFDFGGLVDSSVALFPIFRT